MSWEAHKSFRVSEACDGHARTAPGTSRPVVPQGAWDGSFLSDAKWADRDRRRAGESTILRGLVKVARSKVSFNRIISA